MSKRRGRNGSRLLAPWGLVVALTLAGCGQAATPGGADGADGADGSGGADDGPVTGAAPAPPAATEDGMDPDDSSSATDGTTAGTEPDVLLPPSPPVGAAELPSEPSGAELTLVVGGPDGAQPPVTLSCDWTSSMATGSHPQAEQACADLLAAVTAGNPFTPVPVDAMCTQQYGGDATAEITGAVLDAEGGPVDVAATFSLTDGCEIDRWQQLGAVLSPYGSTT